MQEGQLETRVDEIRRFNRFFTRGIGILREGLLRSLYPLAEARVLFGVARGEDLTASDLWHESDSDPGYLSRTLVQFEQRGLLDRVCPRSRWPTAPPQANRHWRGGFLAAGPPLAGGGGWDAEPSLGEGSDPGRAQRARYEPGCASSRRVRPLTRDRGYRKLLPLPTASSAPHGA
jgi:hypothetical protein